MVRIGIVSPAEIAYRRFMPALKQVNSFCYIGVAIYSSYERYGKTDRLSETEYLKIQAEIQKGKKFVRQYGGILFYSYENLICSDMIDAVYIPLPPALHGKYTKMALEHGKHVMVEKPATISFHETDQLVKLARKKSLALCENYMFVYHDQIQKLKEIEQGGEIGDVRLYSLKFGFPMRPNGDFRYTKEMGGGALLDAGGYTLKLARMLLGDTTQVMCAVLNYEEGYDVDLYGSVTLVNSERKTVQAAFGMDNAYKCEIEIWGSLGMIKTERIFTAPPELQTTAIVKCNNQEKTIVLAADDAFGKSISRFYECISDQRECEKSYGELLDQARLVESVIRLSEMKEC